MDINIEQNQEKGKTAANITEYIRKYLSIVSIVVLIIIFTVINSNFVNAYNIKNMLTDISPLLVMSCGVACVLFLGSIDLSIGSIASCSAVLLTLLLGRIGLAAYFVVLVYGAFAGCLNGILHAKLKVPSFIATLSTQSIWQSAAYILSGGMPLTLVPATWGFVTWGKKSIAILPVMFLIAVVFMLIYYLVQSKMVVGKGMMALGSNEKAARLIGLNVVKSKIIAFLLSGLGASLGGIFFAVKLKSGIPTVGEQYCLMAIASSVLGGVALTGGKGSILMTILGVGLITVIQNGMNVVAVNGYWQQIVFGLLVLFAIYMNSDNRSRNIVVK